MRVQDSQAEVSCFSKTSHNQRIEITYFDCQRSEVHPSDCYRLWFCKDSSQAAEGSWFPIDGDEYHGMKTGDPVR